MIQSAYDFRHQPDPDNPGATVPQPTLPGYFPGLWHLLAADRFFGAKPGIAQHVAQFVRLHGAADKTYPPPEPPATHRMFCCDLEDIAEPFHRIAAMAFLREFRRHTQAKCLIIGGAWPGMKPGWNDAERMDALRNVSEEMVNLLEEQLPLYKLAGVLTYYVGSEGPQDFARAVEEASVMGQRLGEFAPGLERCLWLNGHYGARAGNAEWTPGECNRFLDVAWPVWDSAAVYHGPTANTTLGTEISRRLA